MTGLAIAWAVIGIHSLHQSREDAFCHALSRTHRNLDRLEGVKNFHVSAKENAGGIVAFLRKVEHLAQPTAVSGIEVRASLAGLPPRRSSSARAEPHEHESAEQQTTAHLSSAAKESTPQMQLTMSHAALPQKIVEHLKEADLE